MDPVLLSGFVMKSLPEGFEKPANSLWAYATVETPDRDKDIVRVKGISLALHRDKSPIKVFLNHQYKPLPDGTPPVVGRVEEFRETVHKGMGGEVPALAFRMSWATDGEGNVTPLAAKYKSLYDGGYLDSFSIGFTPKTAKPIKGGGHDYTATELFEISAVTMPANPNATKIKAIKDTLGDDAPEGLDADPFWIHNDPDGSKWVRKEAHDAIVDKLTSRLDDVGKSLSSLNEISTFLNELRDRTREVLDIAEATVVVKSDAPAPQTDDQKEQASKALKEIADRLSQLASL